MRLAPLSLGFAVASAVACASTPGTAPQGPPPGRELTAGLVQREVATGSSAADVAAALGSPNIVSRDGHGLETWIYDRVSTERTESVSSGTLAGLVTGTTGTMGGAVTGAASARRATERTTQSTLTVVIRFGADARVSEVSVHQTRF
jgi:hypothetical protein